jgi:large subunit ribosomal protein L4
MKAAVYNWTGAQVAETNLPETIFNRPWNPTLVHQVLVAQAANRRKPIAHAKGRGEVRGGGRKPWRQKGTGRARHGSIRSPIWKGGGVTHGPTKEKRYEKHVNKKMRRAAVLSVLSKKVADQELSIIDQMRLDAEKTKALHAALCQFLNAPKQSKRLSVLIVPSRQSAPLMFRASANLPYTKTLDPAGLNVEDLLRFKHVFVEQGALHELIRSENRSGGDKHTAA